MTSTSARARYGSIPFLAALLLIGGFAAKALAQHPPAHRLMPDTTVALLTVADAPELAERFMSTAMGRMSQDPQMKPLVGHLYASLREAAAGLEEQLGLSVPELLAIPQGEIAVAVVAPEEARPALIFLMDAGNQVVNARKLVDRITARMTESGIRSYEETESGTKILIFEGPRAGRRTVFLEKNGTFLVGTDVQVVQQILATWNGAKGSTLADNPGFTAVMRRCAAPGHKRPQVTLYVDPIGVMRGVGQENMGLRLAVATLPALGLDSLTCAGASVTFDVDQFDSVIHGHVLLDNPRAGITKMIALRPGDVKPERWVPADVASYTTLHWNVEQTLKELSTLYDSFNGEGALTQLLQRRFLEPTGLDLEKELLPALEGRVTRITRIERPVTTQSQASLLALKLKDTGVFDKAIAKLTALPQVNVEQQTSAGRTYYVVQIPLPGNRSQEQRPPQPCFGILDDYLVVANRESLYQKVAATLAGGTRLLADDPEFDLIAGKIRRQSGGQTPGLINFSRPEETVRWLHELANSQRTRQSLGRQAQNSRFFRAIDGALTQNPLPPFAALRRYLAPAGSMVVDDQAGLHYMAFTLKRK